MATRKRSSRPAKRSTGRSTRGKGNSGSSAPILALGAILGLGAFSLWATAQHKSPQAAFTALFQRPAPKATPSAPVRTEARQPVESKTPAKDYAGAVGPVPRPAVAVAPSQSKPVQQAAIQAPKPPMPTQKLAPPPPPPASARALPMPPRGTNTAAHSPSVIYARTKLTIHKNAWDKSPAIGTVESGREMRSYGKTGKWHRVVVPSTNMIGWVHEDELRGGRNKPDTAQMMTTGSVTKEPEPAAPAQVLTQKARLQPPMAVGQKN